MRRAAQADRRLAKLLAPDLAIYRKIYTSFREQHGALERGELACVEALS